MAEKKEEFVVSDRHRFAPEGELRPGAPVVEEENPAPPAPPQSVSKPPQVADQQAPATESEELPAPPTESEQQTQRDEYHASGKKIDEMIKEAGAATGPPPEMTFERLIESFYMTALIQMGAVRPEGEQPRVDIIGARQTIDSLSLLQEKTKGNLTDREQTLLQNVLFELRMAWIEITNAIAKAPARPPGGGQPSGIKK